MMLKIFSFILLVLVSFSSCDTTPANEEDDYKAQETTEEIAADALDEVEDAQVLTAALSGTNENEMSGKVMIFSPKDEGIKITAVLDQLDPGNYNIYLTDKSSCSDLADVSINKLDKEQLVTEVEVVAGGGGRNESKLYQGDDIKNFSDRAIVVFNELGEVVACGVFKK